MATNNRPTTKGPDYRKDARYTMVGKQEEIIAPIDQDQTDHKDVETNEQQSTSLSPCSAVHEAQHTTNGTSARRVDDNNNDNGNEDTSEGMENICSTSTSESCLDQEVRRLEVLKSYLGVLDHRVSPSPTGTGNTTPGLTEQHRQFEKLTAIVSRIFRAPMALVTIADLDKQYCISSRGLRAGTTTTTRTDDNTKFAASVSSADVVLRNSPFCSHAVTRSGGGEQGDDERQDLLLVTDATKDARFSSDPQVTGEPHVRFYAGAPLVCPEGYRLGTLCVMDTEPRPENSVSMEEKQNLVELAAMAMNILLEWRNKSQRYFVGGNGSNDFYYQNPAQQIACTAHDLLTPLTGIALSLALLKEDDSLQRKLSEQQRDMLDTAANCSAVMNSICKKTMEVFRDQGRATSFSTTPWAPFQQQSKPAAASSSKNNMQHSYSTRKQAGQPSSVNVADLIKNLTSVMETFPKRVPLIITVDPNVPPEFVSDDMKILRSATNFLTNACAKTEMGSIHLKIFVRTNKIHNHYLPSSSSDPLAQHHQQYQELVFECEDTGPGVDVAKYAYLFKPARENTGLGLYSVATLISSIGGKYGFRPRDQQSQDTATPTPTTSSSTGSIFWFCIPFVTSHTTDLSSTMAMSNRPFDKSVRDPHSQVCEEQQELGKIDDEEGKRSRMLIGNILPAHHDVYGSGPKTGLPTRDRGGDGYSSSTSTTSKNRNNKKRSAPTSSDSSTTTGGRKSHALVVEDSVVVRKILAKALSKLGFEVTQATNGMEGLKELQNSLFDLVLCDFLMPIMDGLDCVQQYRQWEAANRPFFSQYIVGISAHASEKDVEQGLKVGMNDFRPKPVTYTQLMNLRSGQEFTRVSFELDNLEEEIASLKRRKIEPRETDADQRVCLVVESSAVISKLAELAAVGKDWKVVSVNDDESALRLLKMRNWDAVLLDDEQCNIRCMSTFRGWEETNRVNRQNNVILMSATFVPPNHESSSSFQVPTGFDGALGKPIHLIAMQLFLDKAAESAYAYDIVTR
jgi:CheY-like chemotaxis protein/signal transduction histidine kinase